MLTTVLGMRATLRDRVKNGIELLHYDGLVVAVHRVVEGDSTIVGLYGCYLQKGMVPQSVG